MLRNNRGQDLAVGFLAVMIFVLTAAGLADLTRLVVTRNFADRVAYEAALIGVSRGRDWNYAVSNGVLRLTSATAQTEAQSAVASMMSQAKISTYSVDVRVLPDPTGGTITGFPPVASAAAFDSANWTSSRPAVGVYVVIPMTTYLFGMVNGGAAVDVHAFGAAEVHSRP